MNLFFIFPLTDDAPQAFECDKCGNEFSGILKHYKCLRCKNIALCRECYSEDWICKIHHGVAKLGKYYQVINALFVKRPHLLKNKMKVQNNR